MAPSRSMTPTTRQPSSSERNLAAWKPTLPKPWTMTVFPYTFPVNSARFTSISLRKNS
jgi:squalene cyclase